MKSNEIKSIKNSTKFLFSTTALLGAQFHLNSKCKNRTLVESESRNEKEIDTYSLQEEAVPATHLSRGASVRSFILCYGVRFKLGAKEKGEHSQHKNQV